MKKHVTNSASESNIISTEKESLLESIFNDSNELIQISDLDTYTMLYANNPARKFTGNADRPYIGKHCYKYMMGFDDICPFCPMRQMDSSDSRETEVDNGKQLFAVRTKIIDLNGKKAFIEYALDITEIRRSQKIFEEQMRTLLQSIPEAQGIFHVDVTEDVCLSINGSSNAAQNMNDQASVDSLVKQVSQFIPTAKEQEEFFHFFCRDSLLKAYENGNVQISRETDSFFDDGNVRSARITARLIMNPATNHLECIIYGMDITEEKKEKLLYESHMREQLAIFNALGRDFLNIFLITPTTNTAKILKLDGYVTTGLTQNKDITYPYYDVCKQYIGERVHPDDREMMLKALSPEAVLRHLSEEPEYVSSYRTLVNGETHYYQFKYMRLENSQRIIAAFQNIDNIILKEKKTQALLSRALKNAEQSNRVKTLFLNSMSPDIRTPLNAIIGCTSLAESHLYDIEEVRKYLSKISIAGNHLLSLVNDILDMSHIESGKLNFEHVPVHLPDFINDLHMIIQSDIVAKHLNLQIDMKNIFHQDIITDKLRLNQVFLNILGNAVKFTEPGGNISFKIIEQSNPSDEFAQYEFHIRDNGIGMEKEFIKHIFETFSREHTSTVSGIQGSGLGMSIANSIVQAMGGSIDVKSSPRQGSEFTVHLTFPVCDLPEYIPDSRITEKPYFNGEKILLVEDNEINQEIATEILKNAGFSVDTAKDGSIALEKLKKAVPGQYDRILMDIQMPVMDGYETTRKIRQFSDPAIADIPIIAMTANAFEEDRQKALAAGMNGHISKPVDISKLLTTLKKYL